MANKNRGKVAFIDIDGTITESVSGAGEIGYFEYALRDALVRKYRLPHSKALSLALKAERRAPGKDPFLALSGLDPKITGKELWDEVLKVQKSALRSYPDAVRLVKWLHRLGYGIFVVSNNTVYRALAKLVRAGLATRNGSRYIKKIYGRDLTGCRKDSPDFYRRVLRDGRFAAGDVVMIGDESFSDMEVPKQTGISRFIIVNRKQAKKVIQKEGAYFVNDLRLALKFLK